MSIAAGTPRKDSYLFTLNGLRYKVLPKDAAKAAGIARTWEEQRIPVQNATPQEVPIPIGSWHQGSGFTYDGLPSTYQWADGWDASSPGRIRTWAPLATGATATLGGALSKGRLGWLFYDDVNGYLYMLRGRYVSKYLVDFTSASWSKSVADFDLGAANVCAGRPALWAGKLYIPICNSSGVAQVFQELTLGGAGADVYAAGPATQEALCFTTWKDLLVRANTNTIATCATAPLVVGNWGATAALNAAGTFAKAVSNTSDTITDLLVYDQYLLVRNNRGLWSFTENLKVVNELPDLAAVIDWEGAGGCYSNGRLLLPHKSGLVAWHPGGWGNVGPEQEGALEGDVGEGWGRTRYCQPFGRYVYTSVNNSYTGNGYVLSFVPARTQGRTPLIPQCHFKVATGTFEGMCVIDNLVSGESTSALAVISVASGGLVATPTIFRIPRSGMTPADDPNVTHARATLATFVCSRVTAPARSVQKKYRTVECMLDMAPTTNTAGLQVWAAIDGGSLVQLLDATGAAATVLTSGFQRFFFPTTTAAVGSYVELRFIVPAKTGGQVALDCAVRDVVIRANVRPLQSSVVKTALLLDTDADLEDHSRITRDGPKQQAELRALYTRDGAGSGGIAYTGTNGESGFVELRSLSFREVFFREGEPSLMVASLEMEVSQYA